MAESEDVGEAKPKKIKVGHPRKYAGGWTSVSSLLIKQIKLHTTVYMRWCKLKGDRQHSEFASLLLDVYELHICGTSPSPPHQDVVVENETVETPVQVPRIRNRPRRKSSSHPIHIECYEDMKDQPTAASQHRDEITNLSNHQIEDNKSIIETIEPDISLQHVEGDDVVITLQNNQTKQTQHTSCKQNIETNQTHSMVDRTLEEKNAANEKELDSEQPPIKKTKKCQVKINLSDNQSDASTTISSTSNTTSTSVLNSTSVSGLEIAFPSFLIPNEILTLKNLTQVNDAAAKPDNIESVSKQTKMIQSETIVNTTDLTGEKSSTTELAVAKIISSLSDSFVRANSSKPGSQESTDQCPNCLKLQKSFLKNVRVTKVRHMATQFNTYLVKAKRQVTTQTPVVPSWSVSTWIDNDSFSRSVETQYWPSPLWTKFTSNHPEVIYNIDLESSSEFPSNFKLYRKGEHLFSTLFGSKYRIQKRPSMRCISVSEFGGPEVMRLLSGMPTPIPKAKQVLVNVKAAGVNPVDTYIRSGFYAAKPKLPYTPGKDGAGFIQQVGENVTKVKKGDRVWFLGSVTGSYAEYCICHEDNIGQLPNNVSFEDGAMIGTPYLTAYRALFQRGKLKRGETVFIHGASGGVGTAAVQICNSYGIRVLATAGSVEGEQMLRSMGVAKVYNHRKEDYLEKVKEDGEQINVIIEMLANVNLLEDLKIISIHGRIVIVGSRGPIEIDPRLIMSSEVSVMGVMLVKSTLAEKEEQINFINEGFIAGWLKPVLWKILEVEFAKDSHHEIIKNNGAKGQIVLRVDASVNKPEYLPTEL